MKRSTLRTVVLAPLVLLSLSSCGLFFATPFPLDMAQAMATRDFSKVIPDTAEDNFRPFVIETGGMPLILLAGGYSPKTDSTPWLYVMREDLSIAQTFTFSQLNTWTQSSGTHPRPFSGSGATIDSSGYVLVGNALFTVNIDNELEAAIPDPANTWDFDGNSEWGFPETMAPWDNIVNIWFERSSGLLWWNDFAQDWSATGNPSIPVRSAGLPQLQIRGILAAPPVAADPAVVLVFEEDRNPTTGTSKTIFVRVLRSEFDGGMMSNFLDEIHAASYPRFSMEDIDTNRLGYTSEGIIAYEYDTGDWTLTPLGSTEATKRLHVGRLDDSSDIQAAWSYSGGYSCVYDRRRHVLTKVAKWWD